MRMTKVAAVMAFAAGVYAAPVVDSAFGFSLTLPSSWIKIELADTLVQLLDTSFTYESNLYIKRHSNKSLSPTEWTQARFIAYKVWAEQSFDPQVRVLVFDSTTARQGSLRAMEIYSTFTTYDTQVGSNAWQEYDRFTAVDQYGFELFVIGDTVDMKKNINYYAAILKNAQIFKPVGNDGLFGSAPIRRVVHPAALTPHSAGVLYNAAGRRLVPGQRVAALQISALLTKKIVIPRR